MPQTSGFTLWLTGLTGAGKSTLAKYLLGRFQVLGKHAELIDHDDFGQALGLPGETPAPLASLACVAEMLTRNDCIAVVATVSPRRDERQSFRRTIGRFFEVFVDCPTETLIERDTEGLYKKALAGDLPNFTGVTEPYETPQHAEVTVRTDQENVQACAEKVIEALLNNGYLKQEDAKTMTGKRIRPALPFEVDDYEDGEDDLEDSSEEDARDDSSGEEVAGEEIEIAKPDKREKRPKAKVKAKNKPVSKPKAAKRKPAPKSKPGTSKKAKPAAARLKAVKAGSKSASRSGGKIGGKIGGKTSGKTAGRASAKKRLGKAKTSNSPKSAARSNIKPKPKTAARASSSKMKRRSPARPAPKTKAGAKKGKKARGRQR